MDIMSVEDDGEGEGGVEETGERDEREVNGEEETSGVCHVKRRKNMKKLRIPRSECALNYKRQLVRRAHRRRQKQREKRHEGGGASLRSQQMKMNDQSGDEESSCHRDSSPPSRPKKRVSFGLHKNKIFTP